MKIAIITPKNEIAENPMSVMSFFSSCTESVPRTTEKKIIPIAKNAIP
jgi:hypothetical protein